MTELGGLTRGPRGPRILTIAVLAAGALALAAAPAQATKPRITAPPQIAGTAQVGQTLTEQGAQWDGRPPPTVTWSWWRCDSPQPDDCTEIANTNATTYKVVAADQGKRLRVLLFVENRDGSRWSLSAATNPVTA